jgi:hypothetical protein
MRVEWVGMLRLVGQWVNGLQRLRQRDAEHGERVNQFPYDMRSISLPDRATHQIFAETEELPGGGGFFVDAGGS